MRGLTDKIFKLERVKVSFKFLPYGDSFGWPLALNASLCFLAGLILWSTCRAIPTSCSLKEFERASHSACREGKAMSLTSRNFSKSSGKVSWTCWTLEASVSTPGWLPVSVRVFVCVCAHVSVCTCISLICARVCLCTCTRLCVRV